jgi:hypothetical protein
MKFTTCSTTDTILALPVIDLPPPDQFRIVDI